VETLVCSIHAHAAAATTEVGELVCAHNSLEDQIAFLSNVGDLWFWVGAGEFWWLVEWVDLKRNSFFVEAMSDYLRDQFLFELRDIDKFDANPGVIKTIKRFAMQRDEIAVGQGQFHSKFIADQHFLVPISETAADRDLLEISQMPMPIFIVDPRRYIKRKSYMLAL
jgi:hypothetical protein